MKVSETHVMVDLETLGTKPGSIILSFAAVPFYIDQPWDSFYERIDYGSSEKAGFTKDRSTLEWWSKQASDIREEAFSGTTPIEAALHSFTDYLSALPGDVCIWGNGSDFDNALLSYAYIQLGIPIPWKYYNNRCYRTLKNIFQFIPAPPENPEKHSALADARWQAKHATSIFNYIRNIQHASSLRVLS
jgi:exodeoxyribonuclease VIII